jgi:hypothetical protein
MITDSRIILAGIFTLAIIAGLQEKWEIAGLAISGGFALLKGSQIGKDTSHEKTDDLPASPPGGASA